MARASFRFHDELNDFLAPERRGQVFATDCAQAATVKHMIEALGVPHTEVGAVLVHGESVAFERPIADGDLIDVLSWQSLTGETTPRIVRDAPTAERRFVADAHLGGLARLLRMTGFDTLFDNRYADDEIERLAAAEQRIVLTRDRELLMRRSIVHARYVRALSSDEQLHEVFERFDLAGQTRPFTRCMSCNGELQRVEKATVEHRLPPRVREHHDRFTLCHSCGRVFWEGSHWRRMRAVVDSLLAARSPARPRGRPIRSRLPAPPATRSCG